MSQQRSQAGNTRDKSKFSCTCCGGIIVSYKDLNRHPVLGILQCAPCYESYNLVGDLSKYRGGVDSTGLDNYCRWCLDGGELVLCGDEQCRNGFCGACIERNFGPERLDEIAKSKQWHCYTCDYTQLDQLRLQATKAINSLRPFKLPATKPPQTKSIRIVPPIKLPKLTPSKSTPAKATPVKSTTKQLEPTKSVSASKEANISKSTEVAKSTVATKVSELVEATQIAKSTPITKQTDSRRSSEITRLTEVTKLPDSVRLSSASRPYRDPTKPSTTTKSTEPTKSIVSSKQPEVVKSTTVKPTEPIKLNVSLKSTTSTRPSEPIKFNVSYKPTEVIKTKTKTSEPSQSNFSSKLTIPTKQIDANKSAETNKPPEPAKLTVSFKPTEPVKTFTVRPAEVTKTTDKLTVINKTVEVPKLSEPKTGETTHKSDPVKQAEVSKPTQPLTVPLPKKPGIIPKTFGIFTASRLCPRPAPLKFDDHMDVDQDEASITPSTIEGSAPSTSRSSEAEQSITPMEISEPELELIPVKAPDMYSDLHSQLALSDDSSDSSCVYLEASDEMNQPKPIDWAMKDVQLLKNRLKIHTDSLIQTFEAFNEKQFLEDPKNLSSWLSNIETFLTSAPLIKDRCEHIMNFLHTSDLLKN